MSFHKDVHPELYIILGSWHVTTPPRVVRGPVTSILSQESTSQCFHLVFILVGTIIIHVRRSTGIISCLPLVMELFLKVPRFLFVCLLLLYTCIPVIESH